MRLDVFLRGYFLLFFVGIFCIAACIGLMFGEYWLSAMLGIAALAVLYLHLWLWADRQNGARSKTQPEESIDRVSQIH
jgi:membrane protein implicated in regulation of membrane protease activity